MKPLKASSVPQWSSVPVRRQFAALICRCRLMCRNVGLSDDVLERACTGHHWVDTCAKNLVVPTTSHIIGWQYCPLHCQTQSMTSCNEYRSCH